MKRRLHWLPLVTIILGAALVYAMEWHEFLTFDAFKTYREQLIEWRSVHYFWFILGFTGIYVLTVSLSIPGAAVLTLLAGFLFGPWLGTVFVVLSATMGASIIFVAVKSALRPWLNALATKYVKLAQFQQGFEKNAFNYLLFLRLVPLFPFWLINIVAALLGVRFRIYFAATMLGIIPGSFVYTWLGSGLGQVLDNNESLNIGIIFSWPILLPMIALGILALLPVLYKRIAR